MSSGIWPRGRRLSIPHLPLRSGRLSLGHRRPPLSDRPLVPRRRRVRPLHSLILALVLAGCLWLGWLWYSNSSLVRVRQVTVVGLSGPDVPQIRAALTSAAMQMTTLNLDTRRLDAAVSRYTFVRSVVATRSGAHAVTLRVDEQVPVARVKINGTSEVVDAAGQLLPSAAGARLSLPLIPLASLPSAQITLTPAARAAVEVLAAAPYPLLAHAAEATRNAAHGVVVQLRSGPELYFGPTTQLTQKWTAAVAVLQSGLAAGASYIDLTDPHRPAPGAVTTTVSSTTASTTTTPSASATNTAATVPGTGTAEG